MKRITTIIAAGLLVFGVTSAYAGSVDSSGALIGGRALMGIGAAMIFPATLAILTNAFTDAKERAAAIGVWSAVSGVAVAAGDEPLPEALEAGQLARCEIGRLRHAGAPAPRDAPTPSP